MNDITFLDMFKGFCPVSGSPVSEGREPFRSFQILQEKSFR